MASRTGWRFAKVIEIVVRFSKLEMSDATGKVKVCQPGLRLADDFPYTSPTPETAAKGVGGLSAPFVGKESARAALWGAALCGYRYLAWMGSAQSATKRLWGFL